MISKVRKGHIRPFKLNSFLHLHLMILIQELCTILYTYNLLLYTYLSIYQTASTIYLYWSHRVKSSKGKTESKAKKNNIIKFASITLQTREAKHLLTDNWESRGPHCQLFSLNLTKYLYNLPYDVFQSLLKDKVV